VRIQSIEIRNYRCFKHLELELAGESLLLVGANAAGKSSVLTAIRLALHGGEVSRSEFRDLDEPIEIGVTLTGMNQKEQGEFGGAVEFDQAAPILRIIYQAVWDSYEGELLHTHAFPDDGMRTVSRKARETIPVISLPAWRDPSRLLALLGRRSLLARLVEELPLEADLEEAMAALAAASESLAQADPLRQLFGEASDQLGRLLPGVPHDAFSLGASAIQPADTLRALQLLLKLSQQRLPITGQSSGLGQASVFAFALQALLASPDAIVLVDEPENALHPQAQRALLGSLESEPAQAFNAPHSAAVLHRRDPRQIVRLSPGDESDTTLHRVTTLDEKEARALSRYSTSLIAEAYFAETAIFVEGFSDYLAVRVLASTLGVDLDASAATLLSLEGADLLKHYLKLLGPSGLAVGLRGLCDLDKEESWIRRLTEAGMEVHDRADLNAVGFQVSDPDLEAELLAALTEDRVEEIFSEAGSGQKFEAFCGQPTNTGLDRAELQLGFVKTEKIRWAPLLAAAIQPAEVPASIAALLNDL
jgi:energy-coupling factor transporter ATP-binding protein EcfA2